MQRYMPLPTKQTGAVRRLTVAYEVRGLTTSLTSLTSFDNPTVGSGNIVNDVGLPYNGFGNGVPTGISIRFPAAVTPLDSSQGSAG